MPGTTETDATEDPRADAIRWIEIDGRRWRTSDPAIPAELRQELVDELMRARRAIKTVQAAGDEDLVADTRRQIHAAKVALGERGEPWWDPTPAGQRERIEATILALAGHRAPSATICPSDAARIVGGDEWRSLVPIAQEVARSLAQGGDVVITQKGRPLDPSQPWRGPVRIRLGRR